MAVRSPLKVTWASVEKVGLSLPDVETGTSWGAPALKLRGRMFACVPTNKSAEPDSLVLMMEFTQRDELLAAEPDVYYLKEHYVDYPCVLVRLSRVHAAAIRDLLTMSWKFVNSKTKTQRKRR